MCTWRMDGGDLRMEGGELRMEDGEATVWLERRGRR